MFLNKPILKTEKKISRIKFFLSFFYNLIELMSEDSILLSEKLYRLFFIKFGS
jgi:hypothetical protein